MVKAGEQTLYLDGVLQQVGTAAGVIAYTGSGTATTIGMHATGQTQYAFAGTIDEPRVWGRYLSQADLTALLAATPNPPTIVITGPPGLTGSPGNWHLDTGISPLTVLQGTSSDSDGTVSSVTWVCSPACGSGTATGTTAWTIPSITLPVGESVITITATDNVSQTAQEQVTVVYAPPVVVVPGGGAMFLQTGYYVD